MNSETKAIFKSFLLIICSLTISKIANSLDDTLPTLITLILFMIIYWLIKLYYKGEDK